MTTNPDPEFVERLEWQLRTASRRQGRFARPIPSVPVRAIRTGVLVLLCVLGGAGAVIAAEHAQDEERKRHLIEKLQIEVEMAQLRVEHAQTTLARTLQLVETGLVSSGEVSEDEERVAARRMDLSLIEFDLREVQVTGVEPNTALSAPLVGEDDLVAKRLVVRIELAKVRLAKIAERYARSRQLAESGIINRRELAGETARIEMVRGDLTAIEEQLGIRSKFVKGELDADEVALLQRRSTARRAVRQRMLAIEGLAEKLEVTRRLEESGFAYGEQRALELELKLARSELRLAELELARLETLAKPTEKGK
ncbi:MAG: hypothetical protein O2816_04200 [Planctomycetota bacterium]|nr:hypothetical protein [Planctomycetota bacterium]